MRIRTVKPEFWSHQVMGRLSYGAQLLALGLLNYADDEGYFYAHPNLIRGFLRPFADESTKPRRKLDEASTIVRAKLSDPLLQVRDDLATLQKCGWVELCSHPTQGMIGRVINFKRHQKIDRPRASLIKQYWKPRRAIDEQSTNPPRAIDEESEKARRGLAAGSGKGSGKEPPVVPQGGQSTPDLHLEGQNGMAPDEPLLARVKAIFRIGRSTPLDSGQNSAWKKKDTQAAVAATGEEDWKLLEWFYVVEPLRCPDAQFRRRDLAQLLNNWNGEIGKAREAAAKSGAPELRKKEPVRVPEHWRELLRADDPDYDLPEKFEELPESIQAHAYYLERQGEAFHHA